MQLLYFSIFGCSLESISVVSLQETFATFTHFKAVCVTQTTWIRETVGSLRYAPFKDWVLPFEKFFMQAGPFWNIKVPLLMALSFAVGTMSPKICALLCGNEDEQ